MRSTSVEKHYFSTGAQLVYAFCTEEYDADIVLDRLRRVSSRQNDSCKEIQSNFLPNSWKYWSYMNLWLHDLRKQESSAISQTLSPTSENVGPWPNHPKQPQRGCLFQAR